MRGLVILAATALAVCHSAPVSLDDELRKAQQWNRTEQYRLVLGQVDGWQSLATERRDLRLQWGFRLVKAQALLGRGSSTKDALALLTSHGEMPAGEQWEGDRAEWLILQANALYILGLNKEFLTVLDRASEAATRAKRPELNAEIELRRGFLLSDEGKVAEADLAYGHTLAVARQLHDRYLEARALNNQGLLLHDQSRYEEAIERLEAGRLLAEQLGASDAAARARGNMGISYYRLGDFENARSCLDAAAEACARAGNLQELTIWTGNLGNVFRSTGDLQAAIQYYKRALEIARKASEPRFVARWLSNLASTSIDTEEWDAAERYNNEARALKDELNDSAYKASSLINAAQIETHRRNFDGARALFESALHGNAEDPTIALEAHAGLAGIHFQRGKLRDAEVEFRDTIAEIDARQLKLIKAEFRLSWLDGLISFYQKYVDFLMSEKQPDRALQAAESSRSKVLTGQSIRPLTASGYRQLARQTGAVLLEYWLSPSQSYLWVITPEKTVCHALPPKSEIVPLIRSYRAVVTGGRNPLDVASDTGLKLYNALLAPAMADAGNATQFIIVPDDELYSLNFETLPDGNNLNRFWIDRATIRISPSLNYLASHAPRVTRRTAQGLLLIGDPVSSLPQYPDLEYASKEIEAINSAMAAAQPVVLQRAAATPDAYARSKPGGFGFIHFSAHAAAAVNRASALDSAVILSGPPDECRLAARKVVSIPLNAELVTVSACRSAGGKTYGGEGLVGFAWAFMKAGAGNVIAGLWDVNDRSTVQLMTALYSGIAAGAPVAEALRSSKLALIHGGGSYAKPFYWAPFELYTARLN